MTGPSLQRRTSLRRSFPHVVLAIIYVSYLISGGLIFHAIEGGRPSLEQTVNASTTESIQQEIHGLLSSCSEDEQDHDRMDMLLESLLESLSPSWSDIPEEIAEILESENEWTISSSVLFCVTTITTIGYGTQTPFTAAGKVIVVLYSIIGIPLSILFIADMGRLLALMASIITSRLRRRYCGKKQSKRFEQFVNEPESEHKRPMYSLNLSSDEEEEEGINGDVGVGINGGSRVTRTGGQESPGIVISSGQPSYLANFVEPTRNTDDGVPLLVIVCLLICYICFGAIIFSISEGWSFLDAFYFSFITLSTIGYGDLYPVKHIERNTMLPITLYTLIGLCWVSMCAWLLIGKVLVMITSIKFKMLSLVGIKRMSHE